jgi:hypothetical protein
MRGNDLQRVQPDAKLPFGPRARGEDLSKNALPSQTERQTGHDDQAEQDGDETIRGRGASSSDWIG